MYSGNSQGYIPAVRDCINARAKRALKQLFPANNRHVDAVSSDGSTPYVALSLLEHYIRKIHLKAVVRSVLVAGDVTGQWNLMLDWTTNTRTITKLVKKNPILETIEGENVEDLGIEDPNSENEETEEEEITEDGPEIVDFATEDLAVIPPTCNDLQKAHAVCIRLRMSPDKVEEMVDTGVFILPPNTEIEAFCQPDKQKDKHNPQKRQSKEAGIKTEGTDKHALIFCVYTKLDFGGERKERGIIFYAGEKEIIGIIKAPYWNGKIPIISVPIERIKGSFFGKSKIEPVKFLQWNLTDFWNMGQDSAMYSLLPIWAVDPLKTPQWAQMVMGLAAVWPVAPADVKQITQVQLYKEALTICDQMKRQIWESMDVNEAMMGRMPAGRKNAQQVGAMQQNQDTNIQDYASSFEEEVLNPLAEMLFEFDQQFRDDDVMIEQRGEIGIKASIEVIPPMQWGEKYFFRWVGTEYQLGMQRMQQQIGTMNILKGIPPQLLNGRTLDLNPILEKLVENTFGPDLAPRILIDKRNQYKVDPELENQSLHNGFDVMVHEADDDPSHLQAHMKAANTAGDPMGKFSTHIQMHMAQLQRKREMAMPPQGGMPGGPGGAAPGVAGAPRPGALPAPGGPRPAQQPPGAIQQDAMADPMVGGRG